MDRKIILASTSPRRRELLSKMGLAYTLRPRPTDEGVEAPPREAVAILAERNARAAAQGLDQGLVLGADTLVSLDGKALGKPRDAREAAEMLAALSGRAHQVFTGVCLLDAATGRCQLAVEETNVRFRTLSGAEIAAYVQTGEPMDKAGAYAIQGGAGKFVEALEGSFENVMGLPIQRLREMLSKMED